MSGGSREHNLIATNIVRELGNQFKGRPCCVYSGDLKVRMEAADASAYPDVMAICGEHQYLDQRRDVVTNPVFIVEVLSDSTEAYDRGNKFAHYRTLPSLMAYLLVAQDQVRAELYTRADDGAWMMRSYDQLTQTVPLNAINAELLLAEVYDKVDLDKVETLGDGPIND
jgi:Uma2 family endonuclease